MTDVGPAPGASLDDTLEPTLDAALALSASGTNSWATDVSAGWLIGHAVNGGLQLAVIGEALRRTVGSAGHPDPLAVSAYFLSACRPGPVTVTTDTVREGRTMATGQASLWQPAADGALVERVRALATYGDLDGLPDEVRTSAEPPAMRPPEQCIAATDAPAPFVDSVPFLRRFDMRFDPVTVGWAAGRPSGQGVIRGWLRMADGREPDPMALLLAVDAFPPVTFDLGLAGWAPTLELTAHVRARPAPGWLAVQVSTRNYAGGLLEEDAEVWDSAGRLVAQSRQLARAPRS